MGQRGLADLGRSSFPPVVTAWQHQQDWAAMGYKGWRLKPAIMWHVMYPNMAGTETKSLCWRAATAQGRGLG